ncbi:MAG: Serine protease [Parcubacteria group bacterium GW2011_GWA2_51_10]|nr:MAG: Serine protease [Parcubacteria group bacterium GW2011_GWA2_51_10]
MTRAKGIASAVTIGAFLLVLFASVFVFAAVDSERPERAGERIPGQYIVVFKDSVSDVDAAENELVARVRGERFDSYRNALNGFAARFSESDLSAIADDPRVAFVSEDRVVSIADAPLDTSRVRDLYSRARENKKGPSAGAAPPAQTLPTGVDRVNAEGKANTGAGVDVAVVDTGILASHPDLAGKVVGGKNCSSSGGGYTDQNGHGTHVAGTIAALNNTQGVVGVAPGVKLWSVRVLNKFGSGSWSSVICGLDFVTSKAPAKGGTIRVANMSLGGSGISDNNCGNTNNDALHKAICRARDAGVTIVVAAGNSGAPAASFVPAAYDDAVITVSALADSDGKPGGVGSATSYGADDTFASFSNFGPGVDIGAPGVAINSTWLSNGYRTISGTSMASPHVAGAAALYIATHPGVSWSAVRDALALAGEAVGLGHSDTFGIHPEPVLLADTL